MATSYLHTKCLRLHHTIQPQFQLAHHKLFQQFQHHRMNLCQQDFSLSKFLARHLDHGNPYQSSFPLNSNHNRSFVDRSGRRGKDREIGSISTDTLGITRGPRASKPKNKSSSGESSAPRIKDVDATSGFHANDFNFPDFVMDHEHAKNFVIKSFSEDNVIKV